ncbi:MAG: hypothetical protein KJO07_13105 [Deltaproteobacteria bacterium]|nr:hypothetical protein [Deltaproteobacteria bacterium]
MTTRAVVVAMVVALSLACGSSADDERRGPRSRPSDCTSAPLMNLEWERRQITEDHRKELRTPEIQSLLASFRAGKTRAFRSGCSFETAAGSGWAMVSAIDAHQRGDDDQAREDLAAILWATDRAVESGLLIDLIFLAKVSPWAADLASDRGTPLPVPANLSAGRFEIARRIASSELAAIEAFFADSGAPPELLGVVRVISERGQRGLQAARSYRDVEDIWHQTFGPRASGFGQTIFALRLTGSILDRRS